MKLLQKNSYLVPHPHNIFSSVIRDEEDGEPHSKKELIQLAKEIANASKEIVKFGNRACQKCSDKRLKAVGRIIMSEKNI